MTGPLPERFGHYRILAPLGSGGMGVVLEALDERLGRRVAIKVLPADVSGEPDRLARFEREARALALLNHPNVVTIHAIDRHEDTPFLVMELIEGQTLRAALERGALWPDRFFDVAIPLAAGLAAAHERGVTHRDLKPENVMLTTSGVKILDFGLARATEGELPTDAATVAGLTYPGMVVGTIPYMSPEQVAGGHVDPRSDIFSLGAILYETIAGVAAFAGPTSMHVASAILRDTPPPLPVVRRDVPDRLARIVAKCLEKDPERRFQLASEVVAALVTAKETAPGAVAAPRTSALAPVAAAHAPATTVRTLAVLPFVDLSPGRDHEYFCDGMADELTAGLARVPGLRLAARTSAFQFRGAGHDVRQIGRQLNVEWVLEGSVRAAAGRVRVTVTLVSARDGYQLWSSRFDRELADVFDVQDEIARGTVDALRMEIASPLVAIPTGDIEAYTLYLKGRYEWGRRTQSGFYRALDYFRQALERDATYAPAHGALSAAVVTQAMYGLAQPADAMSDARESATEALRLSPGLAEPRAALAVVRALYEWDWQAADSEFRQAIEANPGYTVARQWYAATCLTPLGRFDRAREELARAAEVDPLSVMTPASIGVLEYYAGRPLEARAAVERALAIEPDFPIAHLFLAQVHADAGAYDDAFRSLAIATRRESTPEMSAARGYVAARAGRTAEAEDALRELEELSTVRYVSPVLLAEVHAGLDRPGAALTQLERAAEVRALDLPWAAVRPMFRGLRDEPRFASLLDRLGLRLW